VKSDSRWGIQPRYQMKSCGSFGLPIHDPDGLTQVLEKDPNREQQIE